MAKKFTPEQSGKIINKALDTIVAAARKANEASREQYGADFSLNKAGIDSARILSEKNPNTLAMIAGFAVQRLAELGVIINTNEVPAEIADLDFQFGEGSGEGD